MKDLIRKVAETRSSCRWVVVHSGHNNLTNKKADVITSPETLSSKVVSLLQVAKKNFPAAHVIFSALFPRVETEVWPDPTAYSSNARAANNRIRAECGRRGYLFVSHDNFWLTCRVATPAFFSGDGLHLNISGKRATLKNLMQAMQL